MSILGPTKINGGLSGSGTLAFRVGASSMLWDRSGNLEASGDISAFSDERLKEEIEIITDALSKVNEIGGYTYRRIDSGQHQAGCLAQEVQRILPEAVKPSVSNPGFLKLAYHQMTALLVEAVKELDRRETQRKEATKQILMDLLNNKQGTSSGYLALEQAIQNL